MRKLALEANPLLAGHVCSLEGVYGDVDIVELAEEDACVLTDVTFKIDTKIFVQLDPVYLIGHLFYFENF